MSNLALVYDRDVSPGRRARELMKEAKVAGDAHVVEFLQTLELACRQAAEIASGGDIYPAGVRDVAAKWAETTACKARTVYALMRTRTDREATPLAGVSTERPLISTEDVGPMF